MSSLLNSTLNTRPLIKGSLKYIRSDVPYKLCENEIQWLIKNNIVTIVDLRSESETEQRLCPLSQRQEFEYINIPVTGGNCVPKSADKVSLSYLKMVDDTMWEIITTIEQAQSNVLYFCNAGKDRTGVVSALLLLRLGAKKQEIIDDYVCSYENLKEMLNSFAFDNPNVDIETITPKARYMQEFLDDLKFRGKNEKL